MQVSVLFVSLLPAFFEVFFDAFLPAGTDRGGTAAHFADGIQQSRAAADIIILLRDL